MQTPRSIYVPMTQARGHYPTQRVLDPFRQLCENTMTLDALCAQFNRATRDGENMSEYFGAVERVRRSGDRVREEVTESLFTE